jgi:hypothetical protein
MPFASRRILLLTLFLAASQPVWGQAAASGSGSHTVNIGINPITVIAVSGDPLPLSLQPDLGILVARDASTHYNLTTNVDGVRIEAILDFPMPPGLHLRLRAETGLGRPRGSINLSSSSRGAHVVGDIGRGLENGRVLEYELVADNDIGHIPLQERRVTVAIVNPKTGFRQEVSQIVTFSVGDEFDFDTLVEESN